MQWTCESRQWWNNGALLQGGVLILALYPCEGYRVTAQA
jgi:hypothetical protein